MALGLTKTGESVFAPTDSAGNARAPDLQDAQVWSTEMEKSVENAMDLAVSTIQWKIPVTLATTANITLSGEQTIDGTLTSSTDVLVKDHATGALKGIYTSASGAWTRRADSNEAAELVGAAVFVRSGTVNGGKQFICTTPAPIVVGTTALTFTEISDQTALNANLATKADQDDLDDEVTTRTALIQPSDTPADDEQPAYPFTDPVGFLVSWFTRLGALRTSGASLDVNSLKVGKDDFDGVAMTDGTGFVVFAASPSGIVVGGSTSDGGATTTPDFKPYFSPLLCGAAGVDVSVYMSGLIGDRSQATSCEMTLIGASGSAKTGDEQITVRTDDLGASAELVVRPKSWAGGQRASLPITVKTAPVPAVSPTTKNLLMITDSIGNRQGGYYLNQNLTAWSYLLNFIGTMHGSASPTDNGDDTGPLGECREGWETGDYTYAITDRALPIAPGGESAYLALPKLDQRDRNPFIRASTGGDSPSIIRNGYVLDFAFYQSRFSLPTPDVVIYNLATNNVRDRDAADIYSGILDDDTLFFSRMRAAWPNVKIIRCIPGTARDPVRDGLWKDEYIPAIKAVMDAKTTLADNKLFIAPTWAMMPTDGGYSLLSATPDPTTGAIITSVDDGIHCINGTRAAHHRSIAGYVACAFANQI